MHQKQGYAPAPQQAQPVLVGQPQMAQAVPAQQTYYAPQQAYAPQAQQAYVAQPQQAYVPQAQQAYAPQAQPQMAQAAFPEQPNQGQQLGQGLLPDGKAKPAPEQGFRDVWAAVLFFVNVAVMCYFAFTKGLKTVEDQADGTPAPGPTPLPDDGSLSKGQITKILEICVGLIVIAMILSAAAINFLLSRGEGLIRCALWTQIVLKLICGAIFFAANLMIPAIICFGFAALIFCYMRCVENRIRFAAANLKVACTAVGKHKSVVCVSYVMMVLQFMWIVLMVLAITGIYAAQIDSQNQLTPGQKDQCKSMQFDSPMQCQAQCSAGTCSSSSSGGDDGGSASYTCSCNSGFDGLSAFGILICFYWGGQVVKNALNVVVAGVVSSWWFQAGEGNVVGGSLRRAFTTSFGSICLGSLIVAILRALEQMAKEARRRGDSSACIAECILGCLRQMMEYFNKWAFVYVGVYGHSFAKAGKAVFSLFSDRGWTAIINDDLIENALSICSVGVGLLCAAVGCAAVGSNIVDFGSNKNDAFLLVGVMGFFIGMFMSLVVLTIIDVAVATIFVCFAEDKDALQRNHPQHFTDMMAAWLEFHPDEMYACGYALQ